ncbi:MAG: aldehyde ferredoxin oxidoreductase family protein [Bacteroidales bacterium]|nr:aldehyde ferredoxin oxidoreductase family protein [Bacteroidales bacterium]MCF8405322.1 aldehyde ferredoxin oxidoreductase family protein [Bacteroidales bacterium]
MSYTTKYLHIDLTSKTREIGEVDPELLRNYIGGKGLGFALLDKIAPNPDPLGPENPLIFVNGPFTGTKIQTSARTTLVTKSPLTNSILDTHCGGRFGPALKRAEIDYVVVTGKSDKPVYVYISDIIVDFFDADDLWGKGIFETTDILTERHPYKEPHVAAIGPGGENLSKIACIGIDKHRQFGRGGAGAVMGSKNLKAIVADGDTEIVYHNPEQFKELNLQFARDVTGNEGVKFRRIKGTMKTIRQVQEAEILPTKNHQLVQYDDFEKISSEAAREELNWKDTSCYNCGIRCSKWAEWDGHKIEGPEYETTAFLGSGSMVNSIKDVAWANELCNDLGLDTISTGITCSFAMECYEKGLIDDWKGLRMEWGNAEAQRQLIEMMAYRKDLGELFADGTRDAAAKVGKGSEAFAINTYGMELSGINPKGSLTMGLMFAVADFASHTRLWLAETQAGPDFTLEDMPQAVADGLDEVNVRNSLVICDFVPLGLNRLAELLNAATGSKHTEKSLMEVGARLTHLARRYNLRNGRTYKDDTLPDRFFDEESLAGFMRGKKLDREFFKSLVQKYYKLRGWNEKGIPGPDVLHKYGL